MLYRLNVSGDMLSCGNLRDANSGNTGTYECEFTFTGEWAELSAFGVFITKDKAYSVPIIGGKCVIAAEALSTNGILDIGVFGTNGSSTDLKRISTNLVRLFINEGAYRDAAAPETPTPSAWETYAAEIKKLQQAAASSASSALSSKTAAEAAQGKAETAQGKAEAAKSGAESAKSAAENAKTAAEAAQGGAETAKAGAEEERKKAEYAKTSAEAAKASAEEAARNARLSSESAETAEKNAKDAEQGLKDALTGYVKKADLLDSGGQVAGDKLENCAKHSYEVPTDGKTAADFVGQLYLEQATHTVYMCELVSTMSGEKTGYFMKLPSNSDLEACVKKTDYATTSTPGVVRLADSGNPGNNPAVMTEDAVDEYLGKNNYIKRQEVGEALTAGDSIYIDGNKISAITLKNYGSISDIANFSDTLLLTPADMPEMLAYTLNSSSFGYFMSSLTAVSKATVCANLGAAKESDVSYASQTSKGTIRAWLTTEDGENVLNLATEDEADET